MARTEVANDTFTDASAPRSLATYNSSWVNTYAAGTELNTNAGGYILDANSYGNQPWYYYNDTFDNDQYASIEFNTVSTSLASYGVVLQCSSDVASGTRDAYLVSLTYVSGSNFIVKIYKVTNNALGSILNNGGAGDTITFTAGDSFSAEVVSGVINVYKNWTGSGDTPVATYTDGSPFTGGRAGVYTTATPSSTWFITSWAGGNVTGGSSVAPLAMGAYSRMRNG